MPSQDKKLYQIYFDRLCKEELKTNWYLRHYNLFFTLRFVIIASLIVTLQNLPLVQIAASSVIMLTFLLANIKSFRKLRFFESKLTKNFRLIQDVSFTVMLSFVGLMYFG